MIEQLICAVVEGKPVAEALDEYLRGTINRPRMRRYAKKGSRFDPYTGKRKDPSLSRKAKKTALRFRAKRKTAARRLAKSSIGKTGARKRGKLIARMHRQGKIR